MSDNRRAATVAAPFPNSPMPVADVGVAVTVVAATVVDEAVVAAIISVYETFNCQ